MIPVSPSHSTTPAIWYDWGGWNQSLFLWINHLSFPGSDALAQAGTFVGDHQWYPVYIALALTLAYTRSQWLAPERVMVLVWGYLLSWAVIANLKLVLDFPRPLAVLGESAVHVVGRPEFAHSFPSGHAAFVFLLLGSLAPGASSPLRWGLVVLAFWVIWSRMAVGAHFPADVLGGALIGLGCAGVVHLILRVFRRGPKIESDL
ncbi:phosphatase PAP2 family protein [Halothiobacillus sp.]|uniref:phosphatase PAP2 family protein n=1 Tax=Halothiobacillus sp. TaxID=1891311 RepID=UPI002AD1E760|nr:phosphatase PAP2 family protein [Halothiobacillus sp.]